MMLSEHISLAEMINSPTAIRKEIANTPNDQELAAMVRLCKLVLEPLRAHFGAPIHINSGFRCVKLNRAIGGASSSQHCLGEAADLHVAGIPDLEVARYIAANLQFDQLILEFPPEGWVHVSYGARMRHQLLTAKKIGGRTQYIPGFHP